jgi:predicted alpha/beta hydrolase family esterase
MRTQDADILIIPGLGDSGPDHWQSRWASKLSSARRVEQADWEHPNLADWAHRIIEDVARSGEADRRVLLVAHSLGCLAVVHAAPDFGAGCVAGAYLIAPPSDKSVAAQPEVDPAFLPAPMRPLPFPSMLVASRTDPYSSFADGEAKAKAWGSTFVDAGDSGHINVASGHGPWPEGLMRFATFLKAL